MQDILLIEDNEELAELIKDFLLRDGFTVWDVRSGEAALAYLKEHPVKLLVLDVMLPQMDGFAVCSAVRENGNIPILIMSARARREDKLIGYELGADDYMEKPVDAEILSAKAKVLMQRVYGREKQADMLTSGSMTVNLASRQLYVEGNLVELNGKEYELLLMFLRNPGKTLRKEYVFGEIWGLDSMSENQTLTVHIKMLRSKIEKDPKNPRRILTVWGIGYRYEEI